MSDRRQNQAMQRFFEFVFNVPGDCFCFKWSISCFLETVEHMEGDKRWRSICSLGMAMVTLGIIFLLGLSLCPIYYWSEIDEIIPLNNTRTTNIFKVNNLNSNENNLNTNNMLFYANNDYLSDLKFNLNLNLDINTLTTHVPTTTTTMITGTNANTSMSIIDGSNKSGNNNGSAITSNNHEMSQNTTANNSLIWEYRIEAHKSLNLNLWHIQYCVKNYTNVSLYRNILNTTVSDSNDNGNSNSDNGDDKDVNNSSVGNDNDNVDKRRLQQSQFEPNSKGYTTYAEILAKNTEEKRKNEQIAKRENEMKNTDKNENGNNSENPFPNAIKTDIIGDSILLNQVFDSIDSMVHTISLCLSSFSSNNNNNDQSHRNLLESSIKNQVTSAFNNKNRIFINSSAVVTNETCHIISYNTYDATSTQQLSLWFIVLVIILLFACFICLLCSHPIFDRCHYKDERQNNNNNANNDNNCNESQNENNQNNNELNVDMAGSGPSLSVQNNSINNSDNNNNNNDNNNNNPLLRDNEDNFNIVDFNEDAPYNGGNINVINNNNNGIGNLNNDNNTNDTLRSSIQKLLAFAITILCACILNWSSFVFAAVFDAERTKYNENIQDTGITQSNLGTGMLSVNLAMLLTIILAVIHCGSPQRVAPSNNDNNGLMNNNNNDLNDIIEENDNIDNIDENNGNGNVNVNIDSNINASGYSLERDIPSNVSPVSSDDNTTNNKENQKTSGSNNNSNNTKKNSNESQAPAVSECKDESNQMIMSIGGVSTNQSKDFELGYQSYFSDKQRNSSMLSNDSVVNDIEMDIDNIDKSNKNKKGKTKNKKKKDNLASVALLDETVDNSNENKKESTNKDDITKKQENSGKKGLKNILMKKKSDKNSKSKNNKNDNDKDMDYAMIETDVEDET